MNNNEELVLRYQKGERSALDKLIENNMGIIYKMANKFYTQNSNAIDKEDLIQEGVIGLIIAAKKYDFNKPNKANFMTYSVHWIYQRLYRFVVGSSSKEIGNNKLNNSCTSLNTPIGEDGETELEEFIEDKDYSFENKEEQIYLEQLRQELEKAMIECNSLREIEVLKLRYGWNGQKIMTLEEIGEVFNASMQMIKTIQYRALRKLRNSRWVRVNYREFLEYGYIG